MNNLSTNTTINDIISTTELLISDLKEFKELFEDKDTRSSIEEKITTLKMIKNKLKTIK